MKGRVGSKVARMWWKKEIKGDMNGWKEGMVGRGERKV